MNSTTAHYVHHTAYMRGASDGFVQFYDCRGAVHLDLLEDNLRPMIPLKLHHTA